MSHHSVCSKSYLYINPADVSVHLGWDKPLQGYFLYIESDNQKITDEEGLVYGNLYDVGVIDDLSYFIRKLIYYKIPVPHAMIIAAMTDKKNNTVNESKDWEVEKPENTNFDAFYQAFL